MVTITCKPFFLASVILLTAILILPGSLAQASTESVEAVTVSVSSREAPPPPRVAKRMAASVTTIGEHLLMGRKVGELTEAKGSYEKLIQEVLDRVLVGYGVQEVTIDPGTTTHVSVALSPWGEVVREVALEVDFLGISPEFRDLIKKDMGNMDEQIRDMLVGLPVDAVDWAGSVTKTALRELLAAGLPEFRTNLEVVAGPRTTVKVSLAPIGPTIQNVRVSLRSHTIPNFLLLGARPVMEDIASALNGLPVAFVERHRDYFTAKLTSAAVLQPIVKNYGVTLTPYINAGADTDISLTADTSKYRITLEGYLEMGRKEDNTSLKLHVGQYVGKRDEAFMEVTFVPSAVSWEFTPGWGHHMGADSEAGIKYNLSAKQGVLWANRVLSRNITLRLERTPASGENEIGLRYKLHDYLSAEYVITNHDKWLRLVGNL